LEAIGRIRDDETVADHSALAFDPDDVKALGNRRDQANALDRPAV